MTEAQFPHPSDEWLVAYLTKGLSAGERQDVDSHLQSCDFCVGSLSTMQHRLSMASDVDVPVPAALLDRVGAFTPAPPASPARLDRPAVWIAAALDRVSRTFRFPVLVPLAVAGMALFVLVSKSNVMQSVPQQERSRAVGLREILPVTAIEAPVWLQPRTGSQEPTEQAVLTTIKRGTRVAVVGEKGDWYQVTLSDGRTGWMERNAFE